MLLSLFCLFFVCGLQSAEREVRSLGSVLLQQLVFKCGVERVGAWYTPERVIGLMSQRPLVEVLRAIDVVCMLSELLIPLPPHWSHLSTLLSRYVELFLLPSSLGSVESQLTILRLILTLSSKLNQSWPWSLSLLRVRTLPSLPLLSPSLPHLSFMWMDNAVMRDV